MRTGWAEVADGVFHRRYDPLDVSVCAVRGRGGLLLVDTRSSPRQADEVRADLRLLGPLPVVAVVNTHAHHDHAFGNSRFGPDGLGVPVIGHARVPAHLERYEAPLLASWLASGEEPVEEWREVVVTPPTRLVHDRAVLDVGGRAVELRHLGRGHTDNDLLVHVPDAAAWLVGDVLEESGPPAYGPGCFPLDWPATVERLVAALGPDDVVVPGHGAPVDRGYAAAQQAQLRAVADLLADLHEAGVPADRAVAAGEGRWPFPVDGLEQGVAQAYEQLDRLGARAT